MNGSGEDRELRGLFRRSRTVDRASAPDYREVRGRSAAYRTSRSLLRFGLVPALACVILAGGALLVVRSSFQYKLAPQRSARSAPASRSDKAERSQAVTPTNSVPADAAERLRAPGYVGEVHRTVTEQALQKAEPAATPQVPPPPPPAGFAARGVVGGVAGGDPPGLIAGREEAAFDTESYAPLAENDFLLAAQNPLSTFSIDVDTGSYAIVRRFVEQGSLPPADAVRVEELLNYFPYDDPAPSADAPFSVSVEIASCPWEPQHRLARIGLRGKEMAREAMPGANLVFLIDVSGSMGEPAKLPLVKTALSLLAQELDGRDDVAIVVYAGSSGIVLPPTPGNRKGEILEAIAGLEAGGGTNGGEGLRLAYRVARGHLIAGGINRVILATDGDFNLGITDRGELMRFVETQTRSGVSLTALGFGMGNYKDDMLETLADHGDGNYAYVDGPAEARKVMIEQLAGTLATIAKDVRIQVEFNPARVGAYRLIGYENRLLRKEDFNDDRKDAGEIGAGHTVTALYEIVPPGATGPLPVADPLRYQRPAAPAAAAGSGETLTLKLRYKDPEGGASRLLTCPVIDAGQELDTASSDLRFAAAVAAFGMVLRDSPHKGSATLAMARELAASSLGEDRGGHRAGFVTLVGRAGSLTFRPR